MGKLTDQQKNLLGLIARSNDIGDGWRQVSDVLWQHFGAALASMPDLVECSSERKQVRLTRDGSLVLGYL